MAKGGGSSCSFLAEGELEELETGGEGQMGFDGGGLGAACKVLQQERCT